MSASQPAYSGAVETARTYYNSDDADNFYYLVWGGEDIHIGLYDSPDGDISEASRKTVETMADQIEATGKLRVLDVGAGYGGAARYLAKTRGWEVVALNLSEKENERDREMNKEQGLDHLIEVVDASFEDIPFPDAGFDVVWSQDAILHSGDRAKVVAEIARVLKPGGEFIFTDIMEAEGTPKDVLQPVYDRIHLSSLGSLKFYKEEGQKNGLELVGFLDHHAQLPTHYQRVHNVTQKMQDDLIGQGKISAEYIERMKTGLKNWVKAGRQGYLDWGILHFKKKG